MADSTISRRDFLAAGTAGVAALSARADARRVDFSDLDRVISTAVARQDVPFVVAMVADRQRILYRGAAGNATATRAAALDTAFRIFSMTKAIGTLAALMVVDRKMTSLDTPVASQLPMFGELQVIESVGPAGAVLRPPRRPATLRHLLTHTSGLTYDVWNKKEYDWEHSTGVFGQWTGGMSDYRHPLAFDPGDAWAYGIGIDWAGFLVAHLDGRPIERFVREEILLPLGMADTQFEPQDFRDRLAVTRRRNPQGNFVELPDYVPAPARERVYGMGGALYSTAPDYIKFLQFILNGTGSQGAHRLISPEMLRQMKVNQIGEKSVPVMQTCMADTSADVQFFPGTRKTWTFGFLRNEADIPGMRRAGSLAWAGLQNTHYWLDPAQDIAAVFMTQTLPFVEPRFMQVYTDYERSTYTAINATR